MIGDLKEDERKNPQVAASKTRCRGRAAQRVLLVSGEPDSGKASYSHASIEPSEKTLA